MESLTGKGKYTVKVGNHPHPNKVSNQQLWEEYKCRLLEMLGN